MRELELLAPAKNMECGMAAISHGADAVYIGAPRYGARAAAGNSVADIAALCAYAHQFMAKVYVTVNTIIFDDELDDTRQLLSQLADAGVDAVLIQDMALLSSSSLPTLHPTLNLHASTQTDNRTPEKVAWLRDMGFTRVVLARELSVDEISAIHRVVPDIELEVFVHGALCVSYSGLCYASQHCFHRSANRGECAQFCRMQFDLVDADGREHIHQQHLLSLKDLNLSRYIGELATAGATSFKIEGRLKDSCYVKNVTAAYSQLLNSFIADHPGEYRRTSIGQCRYNFTPNLLKTFNRGYTTYFVNGRQPGITSPLTPKAIGEPVGTVRQLLRDAIVTDGSTTFTNGDGLCFFNDEQQLEGFRVNRAEGRKLFMLSMPAGLRAGMQLFRNSDMLFEQQLARPDSAIRKIPVSMALAETADGFQLTARMLHDHNDTAAGQSECTATVNMAKQRADKPQHDNIVRQLNKLGNTPFECSDTDIAPDFPYFIPNSVLTELRRNVCEKLSEEVMLNSGKKLDEKRESHERAMPPQPGYPPENSYLYNAANSEARTFYRQQGIEAGEAFELNEPHKAMLMQCRHCLRYALGHCLRHGGKPAPWREPLSLRLADGRMFPLVFDCKRCQMNVMKKLTMLVIVLAATLFTASCTNGGQRLHDTWNEEEETTDTAMSKTDMATQSPYYRQNDNFIVKADSLHLIEQLPAEAVSDMPVDTITLHKGDRIVVADIITMSADSTDSVWVRVARDEYTIGWSRESTLLPATKPADTISQFIDFFATTHLVVFFALILGVAVFYKTHPRTPIVHLRDISSFYPTLLVMLVATTATIYSSIQAHDIATWQQFYFHPTLNPLDAPAHLRLFILCCWACVVVAIAAIDDTRRYLPLPTAVAYLSGLAAVCALAYIVFNVTTRYYIGYPLLIAYGFFSIRHYMRHNHAPYRCGHCGQPMLRKGNCPRCGTLNS